MQTSSNFFDKSLFQNNHHGKFNKGTAQDQVVSDPLNSRQQLAPWTQINPKYNFNIDRLIKFKQKQFLNFEQNSLINREQNSKLSFSDPEKFYQQRKQIKNDMISNLFNFYKNNKQKKKISLSSSLKKKYINDGVAFNSFNNEIGWQLPQINDKYQDQEQNITNNKNDSTDQIKSNENQTQKNQNNKKVSPSKSSSIIESISIRQYLNKLKEKEKIISMATISSASNPRIHDQFTTNRYSRNKSKGNLSPETKHNSLSHSHHQSVTDPISKQINHVEMNYRYQTPKNPQNQMKGKKKKQFNVSAQLNSMEHSFEVYKKAAEQEVHQYHKIIPIALLDSHRKLPNSLLDSGKKLNAPLLENSNKIKMNSLLILEKNIFKSNIPMSSLFSANTSQKTTSRAINTNLLPASGKKYNTISYDNSFSGNSKYQSLDLSDKKKQLSLPSVYKNYSNHH